MIKRIVSILLCLCMMIAVGSALTSCESDGSDDSTSSGTLPATINLVGITAESTTPEAIEEVQKALNKLAKSRYNTQVILTLKTADEYMAEVDRRVAETNADASDLAAKVQYNNYAIKQANKQAKLLSSTQKSGISKWTKQVSSVIANTLSTGVAYTAEETTVYEDGRIETKYPDAESQIDILMISDKEMYDELDEKGYLLSIANKLTSEGGYSKFYQYIYPTYFTELKAITGDIKAIPNNNLLGEYTYLVVDKALADKYDLDVDEVDDYAELAGFLAEVKAGETVVPMATEPEALGIYTYFDEDIAVGTYYDPIYGYSEDEGTDFKIQNLFDIPEYKAHLALMNEYREKGYFTSETGSEAFAVNVVKGDASVAATYGDSCYVKVLQNPFVEEDSIFAGMLAVASCTSSVTRSLDIIEMLDTDSDAKNILQYGVAYTGKNEDVATYRVRTETADDGKTYEYAERIGDTYVMDNALTGNIYMSYPEKGQNYDAWTYYKETNLDSSLSPFLTFYLSDEDFDDMLSDVIRRAAMTEILAASGIDYDEYESTYGTPAGSSYRRNFKADNLPYFVKFLENEKINRVALNIVTQPGKSNALRDDYVAFMTSSEGMEIMRSAGYFAEVKEPASYTKKSGLTGTLKLGAYIDSGTNIIFGNAMKALAEAYMAMYPDVTIEVPVKQKVKNSELYQNSTNEIVSGSIDISFIPRELQTSEISSGLKLTTFASEGMSVYNNDLHATYTVEWYENKYIAEYKAEHYADIVSPTELQTLVKEKMASLAGTNVKTFDTAVNNAKKYFGYIDNLRTMAGIFLYDYDTENRTEWSEWRTESAKYTDADFETKIFNYVKENYEKEHNLSEEDYDALVKSLMTSVLYFYDENNQKTDEPVSWDEFQATKAEAQTYIEAATAIKNAYSEQLATKYPKSYLRLLSLPDYVTEVYNIMYEDYLTEQELTKKEFENSVKDQYLTAVGTTAEEFSGYSKNSDEYKAYVEKLRSKYKKLLIEAFSSDEYKEGEDGISNEEVLSTLFSYHLENTLNLHEKMSALGGISYDEFLEKEEAFDNYQSYLSSMRDSFLYTLRTRYSDSEINDWSYEEIETNLYQTLYDVGFYSNEMAKYIGLELRDLMLAKSNATAYNNYIGKLVNALSDEIRAKGYDPATFKNEDYETVMAVCSEIIEEKYFSEKVSVKTVLEKASGDYVRGIATAKNVEAYFAEASAALKKDNFFTALVNELQATKKAGAQ